MIQKLKKEIPNEILELMPIGISKDEVPDVLRNAGPIVVGFVTPAVRVTVKSVKGEGKQKRQKDDEEPEGLTHHFWR